MFCMATRCSSDRWLLALPQGRAYPIKKPLCHITIKVKETEA